MTFIGSDCHSDKTLSVTLFGRFTATIDGNPLPRARSRKELLLFALLCLSHAKPLSRLQIAQRLWPFPDHSVTQANQYLRRSLYELRKILGSHADRVQTRSDGVLTLDTAAASVDVVRFNELLKKRDPVSLQCAIGLYGGMLLDEFTDDWVLIEREMVHQTYEQACSELASHHMTCGKIEAAIEILRRSVAMSPWSERASRELMKLQHESGDRSAAIQVYQDLSRDLARRFHSTPGAETTEIYNRIRRESRIGAEPKPSLLSASLSPPVFRAAPIPRSLTRLIGRDHETDALVDLIESTRLVTLVGTGGVGKTRLAISVAERLQSASRRVAFIDLSSAESGSEVLPSIGEAFAMGSVDEKVLMRSLTSMLGQEPTLVILDNCEHLVDACASACSELLAHCRSLRVMTTSRHAFGVVGESIWQVQPLPVPSPENMPIDPSGRLALMNSSSGVSLFVERARAVDRTFRVTHDNAVAVAQICKQLDGIPLAIELAAARMAALSPEQLAERLGRHIDVLALGSGAAVPRQRTLRNLIDWSYALLDPSERCVLASLSVFRGGFTLEAAEAVCASASVGRHEIANTIERLTAKSLISVERSSGRSIRYRMLEPVREYGRLQVEQMGAADLVQQLHAKWYLDVARRTVSLLKSSDQFKWLLYLDSEHDNIRTAFDWAASAKDSPVDCLEMATNLWHYWEMRGHISEGRRRLSQAAAICPDSPKHALAMACAIGSYLADFQADSQATIDLADRALDLASQSGDAGALMTALHYAGWGYRDRDRDRALSMLEQSVQLARATGDHWHIADKLIAYALVRMDPDEDGSVSALFDDALDHAQRTGDLWLVGNVAHNAGYMALMRGDLDRAQAMLSNAISIEEKLGDLQMLCTSMYLLGSVDLAAGNYDRALDRCKLSLHYKWLFGNNRGVAALLEAIAVITIERRQFVACVLLCAACQGQFAAIDAPFLKPWTHTTVSLLDECRASMDQGAYLSAHMTGAAQSLQETVMFAMTLA